MKQFIRILVAVLALAAVIAWAIVTGQLWQMGSSFTGFGVGDGAGGGGRSEGAGLFGTLLIGAIWLLPASPYLCMAAGSLNLITGKSLRVAYVYSLIMLSLMTLILAVTFQGTLELIALGNIVAGGLWAFSFRGTASVQDEPVDPQ